MKLTVRKKLLIYKIILFAFAFIIAFMPRTAVRSKEVNNRVIVEIIGIDGADKISLSAQYIMPTETKDSTGKDVVTAEGETLTEAVEALNSALGRRAELGHCSLVVIGSDVRPEVLGTLMTATDVTADVHVSAAEEKAKDFVSDITAFMKKFGATDADFIVHSASRAHVATNTLLGFLSDLGSASESSYLPLVQMKTDGGAQNEGGGSGGSSGGGSGESSGGKSENSSGGEKTPSGMKIEKLALYGPQGRLGILDRESARGVAWVSAPIEKGIVTADIDWKGSVLENLSGRLIKKRSDVKVDGKTGKAFLKVKAFIEPNCDKYNALSANNDIEVTEALKRGFSEKIKSEIDKALSDSFALGCDPFMIGREFYRYAPDYFESIHDLSKTEIVYDIEVIIK